MKSSLKSSKLLLLLPLRHKKVASAGSLPELLKLLHPSSDICKAVASYVENEEEKVLIIADGWDELSDSHQQEGSLLYELLFETFPLMYSCSDLSTFCICSTSQASMY